MHSMLHDSGALSEDDIARLVEALKQFCGQNNPFGNPLSELLRQEAPLKLLAPRQCAIHLLRAVPAIAAQLGCNAHQWGVNEGDPKGYWLT